MRRFQKAPYTGHLRVGGRAGRHVPVLPLQSFRVRSWGFALLVGSTLELPTNCNDPLDRLKFVH